MFRAAVRCGLGGTALGLVILSGFAFIGVPVVPTVTKPPAAALLTADDLPPGFAPETALSGPAAGDACAALLADPAAGWDGAVKRRYRQVGTGALVWEAAARPAGDVLADLRYRLGSCAFVVQRRPAGYLVEFTGGYLVAARAGRTVVVLRYTGPAGAPVLRAALAKVAALT